MDISQYKGVEMNASTLAEIEELEKYYEIYKKVKPNFSFYYWFSKTKRGNITPNQYAIINNRPLNT